MKQSMQLQILAHLLAAFPVAAVHRGLRGNLVENEVSVQHSVQHSGQHLMVGHQVAQAKGSQAKGSSTATVSEAMRLVTEAGVSLREVVRNANDNMPTEEAIRRLEGKLPPEVASLVNIRKTASKGEFTEVSLAKARNILNSMILNSWIELDDKVIECKEFEERNRGTVAQVNADLVRLAAQIADLEKIMGDSNNGIEDADRARGVVEQQMTDLFTNYEAIRLVNAAEMAKRRSDLAVFNFILNLTACHGSSFLQVSSTGPGSFQVCETANGFEFELADKAQQAKLESMMTPAARQMIRNMLDDTHGGEIDTESGFLQVKKRQFPGNDTIAEPPTAMPATVPPITEPDAGGQWKKCNDGKANCGLLHDTMSLQWGKFKDLVDDLQVTMTKNKENYLSSKSTLNDELVMYTNQKAAAMTALSEATGKKNADQGESADKNEQQRELEHEYAKKMKECDNKISEILYTNVCAVKKVRNEVMTYSSVTPPEKISDCDVKDWVAGECTVACDDACPKPDPYECGGWQTLTRETIVSPNVYGIQCPPSARKKKCNQFKCPVDCGLSEWSAWSKCTKDCEGGVQGKTRSVLVRPKNGGDACDTVQEERSCNTGSCDRDCTLHPWTDWSPCSMACGGGEQERVREVLVPIRGDGKCAKKHNFRRLEKQVCNAHDCYGDEICVANQDLVILLDGSGSLRQGGFETLRDFTANLTDKYQPMYFGEEHMKLAVVLFGNGHLEADGTITPALIISGLSNNSAQIKADIGQLTWQRGFTNLAQGFVAAATIMQQGGREEAQSAVLIIWDGKYSFAFETGQKAKELKDKNVQIFMASVADSIAEEVAKVSHSWVSFPWETNFEHIPGLEALENNMDTYAQALIVKFCPASYSPTKQVEKDQLQDFMLIHTDGQPGGECGQAHRIGERASVEECAQAARQAEGILAFTYGKKWMKGQCVLEQMAVTTENYNIWLNNRVSPPCPNGFWLYNPGYDTYALEPPTQI